MRTLRRPVAATGGQRIYLLRTVQGKSGRPAAGKPATGPWRKTAFQERACDLAHGACAMTATICCIRASASKRENPARGELIDPELSLYREHTIGLLRRYFRMSIELGRLPSVIGREFFRAKVSSYRIHSFEDVVILV